MSLHPIHAQRVPTIERLTQRAAELQSQARWQTDSEAKSVLLGLSQTYVRAAIRAELKGQNHGR